MAYKPSSDPYYYIRPIQQIDSQRMALGQRAQYTPEEITSMVNANFQTQQQNEAMNQDFVLRKEASDRQQRMLQMQEEDRKNAELQSKIMTPLSLGTTGALYGGALGLPTTTIGGAATGAGIGSAASAVSGLASGFGGGAAGAASGLASGFGAGASGIASTLGSLGSTAAPAFAAGAEAASGAATGAAESLAGAGFTFSPIGGLIGLGIGAGLSFLSGDSVICTELNRQGMLPDDVLKLDTEYHYKHVPEDAYRGYRIWGDKVASWMKKSKIVTAIVRPFGRAWAYEMAHRINPEIEGNRLGAFLCWIGIPICKAIYILKSNDEVEVANGVHV